MKIIKSNNGMILKEVENFNIRHTFECGQCFRWEKYSDNSYLGIVNNKVLLLRQINNYIYIENITFDEFNNYFRNYFDVDRDYSKIKKILAKDHVLKSAIEFGYGIRLLNQDMWECLLSFIISANNRIPLIKRAIKNISERYGNEIIFENNKYYSFPTCEQLKNASVEDFEKCGVGFRGKYLKGVVDMCNKGELQLENIKKLSSNSARDELQKLPGVGPKISNCVLLFSANKYDVFPTDVWVKRVMEYFYSDGELKLNQIQEIAREKFGDLAGFAQQYLFYYAREMKIGK